MEIPTSFHFYLNETDRRSLIGAVASSEIALKFYILWPVIKLSMQWLIKSTLQFTEVTDVPHRRSEFQFVDFLISKETFREWFMVKLISNKVWFEIKVHMHLLKGICFRATTQTLSVSAVDSLRRLVFRRDKCTDWLLTTAQVVLHNQSPCSNSIAWHAYFCHW